MHRRSFLKTTATFSACALAGTHHTDLLGALASAAPKKVLVLGGTSFLGPAIVEAAVVAGHTVTLFNRGVTNPGLFPFVEQIRGYRSPVAGDENFSALGSREWECGDRCLAE